MATQRNPRRSAAQWQALVEQWQHSGQSAKQFCHERELGYASFCQWRKRLMQESRAEVGSGQEDPEPSFIDLSSLEGSRAKGWHIVLRLGDGVELTLSQGQ